MSTIHRRYDIDWLRVMTIGLLLIYHIAIAFQPWGVFIGFIQSNIPLESLWIPMTMLNVWRIPLLFFVSGMGVCFAMKKRNWKQLLLERTRRIFLPFLFGIFFIVPIHVFTWQNYYHQDVTYFPNPGHLWFLANVFIYVTLLSPAFYYMKRNENSRFGQWIKKVFGSPLGIVIIVLSFILEAVLMKPETYELYAMTFHGFLLGFLAFLFGFLCIYSGNTFWRTILKWRWAFLSCAAILFSVRFIEFDLKAPSYLMAIESNMWVFVVFGFAYKHLNRPSKALSYLSQSAYPIYIIHMIFLYLGSFLIFPLNLPILLKFILIAGFTGIGCFAFYDLIIKRVRFLRPLFGLKANNKTHMVFKIRGTKQATLIIGTVSFLSFSCQVNSSGQYTYQSPVKVDDGLNVGTLDEVNINSALILKAVNDMYKGRYKEIHSMLIFRDDRLVFEEYFQGHKYKWDRANHHGEWTNWNKEMLHDVKSVTKSITSTCIGIAINKGYIKSVHQSILDYLPDHRHLGTNGKEKITIEHLLTMTSGLQWDEWGAPLGSPANDIVGLWFHCDEQITCILERPLIDEPGTCFTYSGGNMIVLGEIIKNAIKMEVDEFSSKYLFEPLGVDSSNWSVRYPNGTIEAAGGLEITPRAMIKIGATFLNKGTWQGKQIISEQWVEKSATVYAGNHDINIPGVASGKNGYSYSWWIKSHYKSGKKINTFGAGGWGGQEIIVIPELNTVVVFTGGNYTSRVKVSRILARRIIPAID